MKIVVPQVCFVSMLPKHFSVVRVEANDGIVIRFVAHGQNPVLPDGKGREAQADFGAPGDWRSGLRPSVEPTGFR